MDEYEKIPLIAVVGPTASGKTALALEICRHFNGEVISCDSMQVYRGMNIATAKPSEGELAAVKHHLINILNPNESFNVAQYCERARLAAEDIYSRGKTAVLAGGTGLYYSSLVQNIAFSPQESNPALRKELHERAEREGAASLLKELEKADPKSAALLHENNLGRIIRALEVFYTTGTTMSENVEKSKLIPPPYKTLKIGLNAENRQFLYNRINLRVDQMLENGLEEEAKEFFALPRGETSCQAIGYKELKPFFDGAITRAEAIENLKRETRRYAKRQLTWFRRDEEINWLYIDAAPWSETVNKALEGVCVFLGK